MRRGTCLRPPALEQLFFVLREGSLGLQHVLVEADSGSGQRLALEAHDTVAHGEVRLRAEHHETSTLEFNSLDAVKKIVLGSDALMVAPPACVAEELEGGRLVVLGSEPYLAVHYGIVRLKSQPLTAAGARFREYVLEAERAFTDQEKELLERWWPQPRPAPHAPARASAHASARARRRGGLRA